MKTIFLFGACVMTMTSSTNLRQGYMYPQNSYGYQPFFNPFSYFPYLSYFQPNAAVNTPMQVPSTPQQPNTLPSQATNPQPIAQTPTLPPVPSPMPPSNVFAPLYPSYTQPTPIQPAQKNNDFLSLMGLYGMPQQTPNARVTGDNIYTSLLESLNPIFQTLSSHLPNATNTTDAISKGNDVLINNVKVGLTPNTTTTTANSTATPEKNTTLPDNAHNSTVIFVTPIDLHNNSTNSTPTTPNITISDQKKNKD